VTGRSRLIAPADAEPLAALVVANREFLAPWDPVHPEDYFTIAGQTAMIDGLLEQFERGTALPHVVLDDAGEVAGRVTLSRIEPWPYSSARLGYWVAQAANGRGLASSAVAGIVRQAFEMLGLHRVEASTVVHNVRSQAVLERNGFIRFGLAPRYLPIAGRWQDHLLYQRLADD
jgi:ribosomal-protein-alanine N-acetyltransferase